jgi:hypothetical protein
MKTHGKRNSKVYAVWTTMLQRCLNPSHISFARYGGAGITVALAWHTFENFYRDMGDPPAGHTLERRKNHLGYSKANCFWATPQDQANNRSNNRRVTFRRRSLTLAQWSREYGLSKNVLLYRLNKGWPTKLAITTPVRSRS